MSSRLFERTGVLDRLQWGWCRKLPVILQTEAAECGLACLTMIARYYGHDVDLPSLRRKHASSLRGVNLKQLMETASQLGFESRPMRLELERLAHLHAPCILHWDLNHFVVLKRVTARGAVIHDPERGMRTLTEKELSRHFTGVAVELSPKADFKPIKERQSISLRTLTGKVRGLSSALVQVIVLAMGLEVLALVGPFYLQWVLDQVLVSADKNLLALLGIGFLLVTLFQAVISAVRAWTITWIGATLNVQWVTNVFSHLLKLPLDWYEKRHVGDVVSRFSSMEMIQRTLTTEFVEAVLDGLMAILTFLVMALYSAKLTLLITLAFALYALLRWLTFQPLRRAEEDQIVFTARQQTELLEAIRGAQTIKLNNQQQSRTARYANRIVETVNCGIAVQRLKIVFVGGRELVFGIEKIALIWLGAVLVLNGSFTVGMLIAFVAYADQFVNRGANLIDRAVELRMLRLHAERVADVALATPEQHVESAWDGPIPEASIEVRNVSFRYAEGEPWILRNCTLSIAAGDSLALIGPSGCGKTTLAKIILGLLEPSEGEVLYGGVDIRRLGLARYRDQIGAVMQDDKLFAGSIADNIACFDGDANSLRIEAAARMASIHDDIVAMPMGYRTMVGDMGSTLSGGQRQRLLLARAFYRKPALLVMDEATSHLDIERERQINIATDRMNVTRVLIAHRPDTIASAKRVFAIMDGMAYPIASSPFEAKVDVA